MRLVLACVFLSAPSIYADEENKQASPLAKAKLDFFSEREKAAAKVLQEMDQAHEAAIQAGDLKGVQAIRIARVRFESDWRTGCENLVTGVPKYEPLCAIFARYGRWHNDALVALYRAYDQEVKSLTMARKIDNAEAVEKEWAELQHRIWAGPRCEWVGKTVTFARDWRGSELWRGKGPRFEGQTYVQRKRDEEGIELERTGKAQVGSPLFVRLDKTKASARGKTGDWEQLSQGSWRWPFPDSPPVPAAPAGR